MCRWYGADFFLHGREGKLGNVPIIVSLHAVTRELLYVFTLKSVLGTSANICRCSGSGSGSANSDDFCV